MKTTLIALAFVAASGTATGSCIGNDTQYEAMACRS
jgi:hypothetical protein